MLTRKWKGILFLTASALGAMLLATGCNGTTLEAENLTITQAEEHTLSVQSAQTVRTAPDRAEITFVVENLAENPQDCQQQNAVVTQQVIDALKNMGVEENHIQTNHYSLSPQYDYSGAVEKLVGYQMQTEIKAEGIELSQLGSVLQAGVSAGANRVQNVSYYASNYEEQYAAALELAMKAAREKASVMAAADDCVLDRIVRVVECEEEDQYRYQLNKTDTESTMMTADGASPVMAGEIEIEAKVEVTYLILNQVE